MSLGENIKKRRREMNLTQEQLSEAIEVHTNTIRKWEKGNSYPNAAEMEQLANALKVSISYLYAENNNTSNATMFIKNSAYQDKTEINNTVPSMAYWGSLVDNAEKSAENGKNLDVIINSVKTALKTLEIAEQKISERNQELSTSFYSSVNNQKF
ncbi:MAG: helix-turn-helix transcriptional regulator [Synergistaceae bacterium]|nr:helix-turn-helix transcriptional regulator [Synergistaceae bacterium]